MEDEELETYVEVPTESDYEDYEDDLAAGDYFFIGFIVALGCAVFAFFVKTISKHLKNISLKIGNKVEIGIESKDNESKENK
jgi:hypothetical protein